MAMGAVTVTTGATLIVPANNSRHSIVISNNSAQTLFLGDSTVTTANGIVVPSTASYLEDSGGIKLWGGAIYGVVAGTTADIHYWERT